MPKESDRSSALATQPDTAPARNAPPAISTMMPALAKQVRNVRNRLNLENQSSPQALCFFRLRTQMPIATPCTRRVGNRRAAGIGGAQVGRRARRRAFGGGDPGAAPPTSPPASICTPAPRRHYHGFLLPRAPPFVFLALRARGGRPSPRDHPVPASSPPARAVAWRLLLALLPGSPQGWVPELVGRPA